LKLAAGRRLPVETGIYCVVFCDPPCPPPPPPPPCQPLCLQLLQLLQQAHLWARAARRSAVPAQVRVPLPALLPGTFRPLHAQPCAALSPQSPAASCRAPPGIFPESLPYFLRALSTAALPSASLLFSPLLFHLPPPHCRHQEAEGCLRGGQGRGSLCSRNRGAQGVPQIRWL
jgi:hypothetical protein